MSALNEDDAINPDSTDDASSEGAGSAPQLDSSPASGVPGVALPAGWTVQQDPSSGQTYFYNASTGATSWDDPSSKWLNEDDGINPDDIDEDRVPGEGYEWKSAGEQRQIRRHLREKKTNHVGKYEQKKVQELFKRMHEHSKKTYADEIQHVWEQYWDSVVNLIFRLIEYAKNKLESSFFWEDDSEATILYLKVAENLLEKMTDRLQQQGTIKTGQGTFDICREGPLHCYPLFRSSDSSRFEPGKRGPWHVQTAILILKQYATGVQYEFNETTATHRTHKQPENLLPFRTESWKAFFDKKFEHYRKDLVIQRDQQLKKIKLENKLQEMAWNIEATGWPRVNEDDDVYVPQMPQDDDLSPDAALARQYGEAWQALSDLDRKEQVRIWKVRLKGIQRQEKQEEDPTVKADLAMENAAIKRDIEISESDHSKEYELWVKTNQKKTRRRRLRRGVKRPAAGPAELAATFSNVRISARPPLLRTPSVFSSRV